MLACTAGHGEQTAKRPLTVADAIGTTRFMQSVRTPDADPRADGVFTSPNGQRYAVMLIRGDLDAPAGAGNWVEILVGRLDSLDGAKPRSVVRLFTQSWGSPDPVLSAPLVTWPRRNPLVWLPDNQHVAFLWPDEKGVVQVAAVDVTTGELTYVSDAERDVTSFQVAPSGSVLYSALFAHSRERSEQLLREGFTVTDDSDLLDVVRGDVDGYGTLDRSNNTRWYIAGLGGPARRLLLSGDPDRSAPLFPAVFSADGRRVFMGHYPAQVPAEWSRYTQPGLAYRVSVHKANPYALTARYIKQPFVVDLETGQARPLWPAPADVGTQASWSPSGSTVLLASAFLPLDSTDSVGLSGRAVAEVDVATGQYWQVMLPADSAERPVTGLRWLSADRIEVAQQASTFRFRKGAEGWNLEEVVPTSAPVAQTPANAVSVEWRQDSNTPPVLYAVDTRVKRERAVLDPNPALTKRFHLGRVEFITWKDKQGHPWNGRLYHPATGKAGERVPLVIQTHGFAPATEFSLYGYGVRSTGAPGLGPGFSVYAAQPLASKGIAVLQMEDLSGELARLTATPDEPKEYLDGYETAVEYLAGRGLIDPAKVGLVGFSRTGWHVSYALTQAKLRFAAAIISDSFMGGYVPAMMLDWQPELSRNTGAEPFGEGLRTWLERAPAFNVEKLTTPLRIQAESGGLVSVIGKWELFSRARHLKKPVELYVIPQVERGSHGIQNPLQCLAAQQGAVDWFERWLLRSPPPSPTQQ
jgi:dienelactone hydrolase